ncbi:MAG: ferrous iron transport protein A [Thermoplasmatales archaeon]|nr:MAG: ferrous iron transport protein A [Thermoplasmatales archaeon]
MNKKTIPLTHLSLRGEAKIIELVGGRGFQRRLRVMGVREGQKIKVVSKQPFHGPLTVAINGCQMTLGRGMAQRIIVEEL